MTQALIEFENKPDVRADLREMGLKRAGLFLWDRTAQETLEYIQEAVDCHLSGTR